MLEGRFEPMRLRVLVVDDELRADSADGRAKRALLTDMRERNLDVVLPGERWGFQAKLMLAYFYQGPTAAAECA